LYVGSISGGSSVVMVMADGSTVTRTNLVAGAEYPWRIKRVMNTGTTASNLIADY
jgi:hypothetical protein